MTATRNESPMFGGNFPGELPQFDPPRADFLRDNDVQVFDTAAMRKRAEQDALLLANRIRLLRTEEERARKKIYETEKRTHEVLSLRRRNGERRQQKEAADSQKESEESALRIQQQRERDEQHLRLMRAQQDVNGQRVAVSGAVRREREDNRACMKQNTELMMHEAKEKHDSIMSTQMEAAANRKRFEEDRINAARQTVEDKRRGEENETRQKLSLIDEMQREEAALIARLQRTQDHHRAAFLQLEDLLHSGPPPDEAVSSLPLDAAPVPLPPIAPKQPQRRVVSRPPRLRPAPALVPTAPVRDAPRLAPAMGKVGRNLSAPPPRTHNTLSAAGAAATAARHVTVFADPASKFSARPPLGAIKAPSTASLSTASGLSSDAEAVARSIICSPSSMQQPITYTTVDGMQLAIGDEDELDLDALLNG
eukprot:NODE_6706_length_1646_cov_7.094141.p1 GENE.NODE_6706_length_1646_cov_7.094141~~NODE_6706_length_1646_cov_7.094141.p1  ORF type:complete len:424 (+),score=107.91 NODE_6706_length_1646_cov_7.094141:135-1406(+)